ncbi:hypothetical protein Tco_1544712 [Tanacetum coccineum]
MTAGGTESGKQDTSSRSRNDIDVDDANIRPSYDEEPMVEVQSTTEHNVSANRNSIMKEGLTKMLNNVMTNVD